uniref:Transposase Tc1-like domain-containing protein n=1 Tax=Astyanax mexicanus TaxID=7994 RepID=A0A8B9RI20_ASTMX
EQLGISESSVCKALKKNCSKRTNCSGVRKTSARDNKQLRKIAVSNRFKSTSELTDLWNKQTGADVSRSTTYRRLRELGFKSRVPAVKPLLNKKQMEKRLKWPKEHGEWTTEDWQKVVFSDDSPTQPQSGRPHKMNECGQWSLRCIVPVWWLPGEQY